MNSRKAWIVYSLLRLVFFAVPFGVLMWLLSSQGVGYWPTALISVIVAALISVSLSLIFLSKLRDAASTSIYDWRMRDRTADDIVEDEALDATRQSGTGEQHTSG